MARFEGAVVREQGVEFAIMIVKRHVLKNPAQRDEALAQATEVFGGLPTVLMAQGSRGVPEYYGRRDIAKFMANVPIEAVPWRVYTLSGA